MFFKIHSLEYLKVKGVKITRKKNKEINVSTETIDNTSNINNNIVI